jgi:hypothetical protein
MQSITRAAHTRPHVSRGEPVRHRYNPGGNPRVNAILHRMAVTQLRREPRARRIYANAARAGTPRRRPAACSSASSPTSSTGA